MDEMAELRQLLDDRFAILTQQMEDLFRLLGGRMKVKEAETDRRFRSGADAVARAETGRKAAKRPSG